MSKIYEITGIAKSGRSGTVTTNDKSLTLQLGSPNTGANLYNPEQLFACGYASCFSQAMFAVTKNNNLNIKEAPIEVTVQLHSDEVKGFNLYVGIDAKLDGIDIEKAKDIMKQTHNMCPYSKLVKPENFLFIRINGVDIK